MSKNIEIADNRGNGNGWNYSVTMNGRKQERERGVEWGDFKVLDDKY